MNNLIDHLVLRGQATTTMQTLTNLKLFVAENRHKLVAAAPINLTASTAILRSHRTRPRNYAAKENDQGTRL